MDRFIVKVGEVWLTDWQDGERIVVADQYNSLYIAPDDPYAAYITTLSGREIIVRANGPLDTGDFF